MWVPALALQTQSTEKPFSLSGPQLCLPQGRIGQGAHCLSPQSVIYGRLYLEGFRKQYGNKGPASDLWTQNLPSNRITCRQAHNQERTTSLTLLPELGQYYIAWMGVPSSGSKMKHFLSETRWISFYWLLGIPKWSSKHRDCENVQGALSFGKQTTSPGCKDLWHSPLSQCFILVTSALTIGNREQVMLVMRLSWLSHQLALRPSANDLPVSPVSSSAS